MQYRELTIETSETGIEILTAVLDANGYEDVEVADPRDIEEIMSHKESYEWDYIEDAVAEAVHDTPKMRLFFAEEEAEENIRRIQEILANLKSSVEAGDFGPEVDLGTLTLTWEKRDDAEWKDKWKAYFKPFHVSEHIVVRPSWEEYTPKEGEMVIEIDPGMAFGIGTHETTSMCLTLIDKYLKPGQKVLDMGCGSGILSIAASFLGAGDALGIDIDREAVRVAEENIAINHADHARAEYGDITQGIDYSADLIVGNLMAELLCMLAKDAAAHLAEDGIFLSSGILVEKKEMVSKAYEEAGLEIVEILDKGEWCAIAARHKKA